MQWLYVYLAIVLACGSVHLSSTCPEQCECQDVTVDCSGRGLLHVPRDIPTYVVILFLQRNNISQLTSHSFVGLGKLRQLNLEFNQISFIGYRSFVNLQALRNLNLGNNKLSCIQDLTFQHQQKLESLTLSYNNLSTFAIEIFNNIMPPLHRLRLHSNRLHCDCHLSWLQKWLKSTNRGLAVLSVCHGPYHLRGLSIQADTSFECNGANAEKRPKCEFYSCPTNCHCNTNGYVDCSEQNLDEIPQSLPRGSLHLRFGYNRVSLLPANAFIDFEELQILTLNFNGIKEIDPLAFYGLNKLKFLHLQHNEIVVIPQGTFQHLKNLEVLFLHGNHITCLKRSTFDGLKNLTDLNLYNNKLQTLPDGIFHPLRSLTNLHLASNPLQCDCRLRWLTKYLKKKQSVEKSSVKCYGPGSVTGKFIAKIKKRRYRNCSQVSLAERARANSCLAQAECPDNCQCEGSKVTCSGLSRIPDNIPTSVSELVLRLNTLEVILNDGIFLKYSSLKKLDLSNNQISQIEDGAFRGAVNLKELRLNENHLNDIRGLMFLGLGNLRSLQIRNNRLTCLGNHSFVGLKSVRHLDLFSNDIKTIDDGSLNPLVNLETLNLLSNQLNCNCRLRWLPVWLQQQSVAAGNPRCSHPYIQRNIPLTDINPNDFRCPPSMASSPSCTPKRKCPSKCSCEDRVVRCSDALLDTIPIDDIPADVTGLYLNGNIFKEIPLSINKLSRLQRLDLSGNNITRIVSNQFANLTSLRSVLLAYNQIQCVQIRAFTGLTSLQTLSLHSNYLSSIPEGSFSHLTNLRRLGLGANPWHCDCNLRWLIGWLSEAGIDTGIARCAGPSSMANRLVGINEPRNFQCSGPLDIAVAAKCNPCVSSPCQYGSTCNIHATEIYQCVCKLGFKGRNCETPIDPCILNPCSNRGRCHARNERVFECSCQPGFSGHTCETNIDDCFPSACLGVNQVCVDGINNFTCECLQGWSGEDCTEEVKDICKEQQPCLNDGHCVSLPQGSNPPYRCECTIDYRGETCNERYRPCQNNKCQNGGECVEDSYAPHHYRCICVGDYSGQFCNIFQDSRVNILQDDPCLNNACKNRATCQASSETISGYRCQCLPGFTDIDCASLTSISFFQNGSFVDLKSHPRSNLGVSVLSSIILFISFIQDHGILFYWGTSPAVGSMYNFVSIELFSGHVRLKRYFGDVDSVTLYSPAPINDGITHKVEVNLNGSFVSLRVDDGRTVSRTFEVFSSPISINSTVAQAGGVDTEVSEVGKRKWFFSDTTSFKGSMQAIFINGEMIEFSSLEDLRGNVEGIKSGSWDTVRNTEKNCSLNCLFGSCIISTENQMKCVCKNGYTGILCELPNKEKAIECQPSSGNSFCQHGKCFISSDTLLSFCTCDAGYSGSRCQHRGGCGGLECIRGTCVSTPSGFQCKCPKAYTGKTCQIRVKKCPGTRSRQYFSVTKLTGAANSTTDQVTCRSLRSYTTMSCNGPCHISSVNNNSSATCCRAIKSKVRKAKMKCSNGRIITQKISKIRRCGCLKTC